MFTNLNYISHRLANVILDISVLKFANNCMMFIIQYYTIVDPNLEKKLCGMKYLI